MMASALGRASATAHGVLVHGTRRIRPGRVSSFVADFDAWAASAAADGSIRAAFAFPDPADAELFHHCFWSTGDLPEAGPASEAFASTPDDPDTFEVFGNGQVGLAGPAARCNRNAPLAGFIRDASNYPPSSADAPAPMIGFFRRAIRPGQLEALAKSFQVVCDIWYADIPGMLASTVSVDAEDENFVQDVRIFADRASYAAHVDKSNKELTKAMEVWFDNYDTSIPHTGALFAPPPTGEPSTLTSSIKDKPVKLAFNQFFYGHGGMVGKPPALL